MSNPDNPETRARAVRVVRLFLPAYALATGTLGLPFLLRATGADSSAASMVATVSVALMCVGAPAFLLGMARMGQYGRRGGLRFRLGPALFGGRYVLAAGVEAAAPEAGTAAPARTLQRDLEVAGLHDLAQALAQVVAEGELLQLADRRLAGNAEAAEVTGPLRGAVEAEVRAIGQERAIREEEVRERLERLLAALRAANDRLRRMR